VRPRRTAAALGALLVPLAAAAALAQTPYRGGLWADVGIGPGRLSLTCTTCSAIAAANGFEVTASVGGAPTRNVLLGVQGQVWTGTTGSLTQRVRSLLAIVQWYPWPTAGLFVRAGTGVVQGPVSPEATGAQPATVQNTGVGLDIGLGYDFPLSRHLGLTIQAASHVAALGDLVVNGQPANDVIAYVTRIGIAVVLR
jgi:hypothetical protein